MTRPALILQQSGRSPEGLLGDWCRQREIEYEVYRTDSGEPWPTVNDRPFICCLGGRNSPLDRDVPAVAGALELVETAVEQDVPVLGLCYGGQVLATVLGGQVEHSPDPQHGWYVVQTQDPDVVPPGPWLQWHYDRFSLPPGATELARTDDTVQAFVCGPHLGTQFHPESTVGIVSVWARSDTEHLAQIGISDGETLLHPGSDFSAVARDAAFALFDAFWQNARAYERSGS